MKMKYIKNENPAAVSSEKCTGCGICLEVCPHGVFELSGGKAFARWQQFCMGCGACVLNCPVKAVSAGTGVGCAAAVISSFRKKRRGNSGCSCRIDDNSSAGGCCNNSPESHSGDNVSGPCCPGRSCC